MTNVLVIPLDGAQRKMRKEITWNQSGIEFRSKYGICHMEGSFLL